MEQRCKFDCCCCLLFVVVAADVLFIGAAAAVVLISFQNERAIWAKLGRSEES